MTRGETRVQIGRVNTDKGTASDVALWGPFGYYAVPNAAAEGEAASVVCLQEGSRLRGIAGRDNRYSEKAGTLEAGDIALCSSGEQRSIWKNSSQSITHYTVNQKTDLSMMVHLDGEAGVVQVVNGNAQVSMEDDRIFLGINGGASILITKDSVTINGKEFHADCGSGTLGLIGPVRPVPGLTSVLAGPSGFVAVPSSTWVVAV